MNFYYFIATLLSILALLEILAKYVTKEHTLVIRAAFCVSLLLLIIVAGFRTKGPDLPVYFTIFEIGDFDILVTKYFLEPGFSALIELTSNFGFRFFLVSVAATSVLLYGMMIRKYSPFLLLSVLIYFSTIFMIKELGQIRHGVALSIMLCAYSALFKDKKIKFILLLLLATSFHFSAVCALPILLFYKKRVKTFTFVIWIIALMPFMFLDLKSILFGILGKLPIALITSKTEQYSVGDYSSAIGINSTFILLLILFSFFLLFRKKISERFEFANVLMNIYFLGIVYYMTFNSFSELGQRTTTYFRMTEMLIIPMIISIFRAERFVLSALFCINAYFSIYKLLSTPVAEKQFLPYKMTTKDYVM